MLLGVGSKNATFVNGSWNPAADPNSGEVSMPENRKVTMEGVLLTALHKLALNMPELRGVHSPHSRSDDASAEVVWQRNIERWSNTPTQTSNNLFCLKN